MGISAMPASIPISSLLPHVFISLPLGLFGLFQLGPFLDALSPCQSPRYLEQLRHPAVDLVLDEQGLSRVLRHLFPGTPCLPQSHQSRQENKPLGGHHQPVHLGSHGTPFPCPWIACTRAVSRSTTGTGTETGTAGLH